jgi:tetratricopeptide (TPR) repeat protein
MRRAPPPGRALPIRHTLPGRRAWLALLCSVLALGFMTATWADQTDRRLDGLFERLRVTSSKAETEAAQQQIWQIWIESDDMLANRLMQEGIQAMVTRQHALALEYFDRLVEQAPAFAEGWNKRATVYYLMENYEASVLDIERTLELEPRHFGALSGLGMIYDAIGEPAAALRSFEAAVAINPHLDGARQRIEALRRELAGSPT